MNPSGAKPFSFAPPVEVSVEKAIPMPKANLISRGK
jgi:hypothetical protein